VFGGEVVRTRPWPNQVYVSAANDSDAQSAVLYGGKFRLSTYPAERVRKLLDDGPPGTRCRTKCATGFLQRNFSRVPGVRELLVEPFPGGNNIPVWLSFEGLAAPDARHAVDAADGARAGGGPLGFIANEYAVAVWAGDMLVNDPAGKNSISTRCSIRTLLGDTISGLACGIRADEARLPQLRHHFRPDRARFTGEEKSRRQCCSRPT